MSRRLWLVLAALTACAQSRDVDGGPETPPPDSGADVGPVDAYAPRDLGSDTGAPDATSDSAVPDLGPASCTTDADGDGYVARRCGGPDCNDAFAAIHPGATEVCNLYDDNCDGSIDEGLAELLYADCDGDGVGGALTLFCSPPLYTPTTCRFGDTGVWVDGGGDCDDENAALHPGAAEVCNGRDDDCDGTVDGALADRACASDPHEVTAFCGGGGACVYGCESGYLDCDTAAPGCESDWRTSWANCGTCGTGCGFGCDGGSCDAPGAMAAGAAHTCAVSAALGNVWCWGANDHGQLGDGTTTDRWSATRVVGIRGVDAIAAGAAHTCARTGGETFCWGANADGQLGDGTTVDSLTPVTVIGAVSGPVAVGCGARHCCAPAGPAGALGCWGANDHGQLGDGTTTSRSLPVLVAGLPVPTASAAVGLHHTCVVVSGEVRCWGGNERGQLGDGTTIDSLTPVTVIGLTDAVVVAAGDLHSCALRATSQVVCWGANDHGELSDGTFDDSAVPVIRIEDRPRFDVFAGGSQTCATEGAVYGGVYCSGVETADDRGTPYATDVSFGSRPVRTAAVGAMHLCAESDTAVYCQGANDRGQLGKGPSPYVYDPVIGP